MDVHSKEKKMKRNKKGKKQLLRRQLREEEQFGFERQWRSEPT